ncbi:hypothetical protein [Ferranicluibacter rubi]|uniref:Uncharacterized protein n=1 Tax=Ferranicluibacter rubi TaxID=2715133 RepID=A0AA43ZCA8_9HYPH|nr:hypothetical protein [Ferranicluibacter rubi]PYE35627.1 hypothetical protein C8J37_1027 [Rhizobium sp. PP-WC-1G-195]TCP87154.1 hypothetical protein C8J31_10513 [Rhizobium sp. PP-CC-2G-626]TCQ12702.1 hypothetical protein C8J34_1011347 [Rhizobium sp. PP-F2F-G36]TCQ28551.1 hypothetical protein C8J33_1011202 [Rhizobium sp. PP-CC-3G-465]NHT75208.1 hypothetical protein [Ferranicluibacter rubi]
MASDDIWRMAWTIVAEHMTRGETDPTKMVADGIQRERDSWHRARQNTVSICGEEARHEECLVDRHRLSGNRSN